MKTELILEKSLTQIQYEIFSIKEQQVRYGVYGWQSGEESGKSHFMSDYWGPSSWIRSNCRLESLFTNHGANGASAVWMRWPTPWPSSQLILREVSDSSLHLWRPPFSGSWIRFYWRHPWPLFGDHSANLPRVNYHYGTNVMLAYIYF